MRLYSSISILVAGLAQVRAQYLVSELSFGHESRISPDGKSWIPNFSLQGAPGTPELLSNKLILTPPAPGNQRGAVWSDKTLQKTSWIADVEFRASGPERGGGNLQVWLVRDGAREVGTGSIYTVSQFEGLALVVDGHGGYGGMIRGFLNDGTTDFRKANVDQLSFGHCTFGYRNLGRPSQIKLRHSESSFRVEVDGRLCFESDKVRIPSGYNLGITAASAENPDSFEVFKLAVLSDESAGAGSQDQGWESRQKSFGRSEAVSFDEQPLPDQSPEQILSSKAQFADLHNRLQSVSHLVAGVQRTVTSQKRQIDERHGELLGYLAEIRGRSMGLEKLDRILDVLDRLDRLEKLDKLDHLEQRVAGLERDIQAFRNDVGRQVRNTEQSLRNIFLDRHHNMHEHIKAHLPGHTMLILVVVGTQGLLVAAYVMHKRRKFSPKKYL